MEETKLPKMILPGDANYPPENPASVAYVDRRYQEMRDRVNAPIDEIVEEMHEEVRKEVEADLRSDITDIGTKVTGVEENVDTLSGQVAKVESSVDAVGTRVDNVEDSVKQLSDQVGTVEGSVDTNKSSIDNVAKSVSTLESRVDGVDKTVEGISGQVGIVESSVSGMNDRVTTVESSVKDLNDNVASLGSHVDDVESSVSKAKDSINALQVSVDEIPNSIKEVKDSVKEVKSSITTVSSSVDSLNARVTKAEGTVNEVSTRFTDVENSVTSIGTRVTNAVSTVNAMGDRVTTVEETVDGFESRVSDTEDSIKTIETRVSDIETNVSDIGTKVATAETTLSNLNSQVSKNTSSISTLTEGVSEVKDTASSLSTQIANVKTDFDSKIGTVNTGLNSVSNRVTNLESQASDLASRTTTIEGKLPKKADLGDNGLVLSSQLPSYVDAIVEEKSLSEFPIPGETEKIYVALDTNLTYRWGGSGYVEISKSLAIGTAKGTAYDGAAGAETRKDLDTAEGSIRVLQSDVEGLQVNARDKLDLDTYYTDYAPTIDNLCADVIGGKDKTTATLVMSDGTVFFKDCQFVDIAIQSVSDTGFCIIFQGANGNYYKGDDYYIEGPIDFSISAFVEYDSDRHINIDWAYTNPAYDSTSIIYWMATKDESTGMYGDLVSASKSYGRTGGSIDENGNYRWELSFSDGTTGVLSGHVEGIKKHLIAKSDIFVTESNLATKRGNYDLMVHKEFKDTDPPFLVECTAAAYALDGVAVFEEIAFSERDSKVKCTKSELINSSVDYTDYIDYLVDVNESIQFNLNICRSRHRDRVIDPWGEWEWKINYQSSYSFIRVDQVSYASTSAELVEPISGEYRIELTNGIEIVGLITMSRDSEGDKLAKVSDLDGYVTSSSVEFKNKRDKTDLTVYTNYAKVYANDIALDSEDDHNFTGAFPLASSTDVPPSFLNIRCGYDTTTGKLASISGGVESWYAPQESYYQEQAIDFGSATDYVDRLNAGDTVAVSAPYFTAEGTPSSAVLQIRVEFTGGANGEGNDTLAKISDIPEVPTEVSAFTNDAGYLTEHQSLSDYLRTSDLAAKETDPKFTAWKGTTTNSLIAGGGNTIKDSESNHVVYGMNNEVEDDYGDFGGIVIGKNNRTGYGDSVPGIIVGSDVIMTHSGIGIGKYIRCGGVMDQNSICIGKGTSAATLKSHGTGTFNIPMVSPEYFYFNATSDSEARTLQSYLDEKANASTVSDLAAKVDTANATLEEVV
jgi:predicted  nucleic acid-binding Zn-ribbon protein